MPNDLPWKWGQDGTEAQFQAYLKFPTTLGGKYDFIMNVKDNSSSDITVIYQNGNCAESYLKLNSEV